jgi:phosphatidylglycerophosphatase A
MNASDSPSPTRVLRRPWQYGPAVWLATGFWVGFCPVAPGTVGTLLGLPLAWGLSFLHVAVQIAVLAILSLAGIPLCTAAARELGLKDPGSIVFDEIVSLGMTFLWVPISPVTLIAGFLLHRLFDIAKPPPIRRLERLPEGLGIMADDLLAGIYANIVLHLLLWLGVFERLGG